MEFGAQLLNLRRKPSLLTVILGLQSKGPIVTHLLRTKGSGNLTKIIKIKTSSIIINTNTKISIYNKVFKFSSNTQQLQRNAVQVVDSRWEGHRLAICK